MKSMLEIRNIRRTIYLFLAGVFVILIGVSFFQSQGVLNQMYSELNHVFGTLALVLLYITFIIGPLTQYSIFSRYRTLLKRSRRALGISTFFFSLVHAGFGFFGIMLGGSFDLNRVGFIPTNYILPLIIGAIALGIFTILAFISTDTAVKKMGKNWYRVQRLIYIAGLASLVHVYWIGSSFQNITSGKSLVLIFFVSLLFILWALRLDLLVFKKFPHIQKAGVVTTITVLAISSLLLIRFLPSFQSQSVTTSTQTFSPIHLQHLQNLQAQGANFGTSLTTAIENSKRYSVSFLLDSNPNHNSPLQLSFAVTNADNGQEVKSFSKVYEKFIHLILISDDFSSFEHLHPDLIDGRFVLQKTFTKVSNYRVYLNFTPRGDIEQQFAFRLQIGEKQNEVKPSLSPTNKMQNLNNLEISLDQSSSGAKDLTLGKGIFKYTFKNSNTGQNFDDLRPYLGAFGHLTMVNVETGDAIHVHPNITSVPQPDEKKKGNVEFLPLGLVKKIESGTYKLFAEFNISGEVKTVEHVINVNE
jgi:DMSO/TMAO reductase YedYZ heme-binding membrane subunit